MGYNAAPAQSRLEQEQPRLGFFNPPPIRKSVPDEAASAGGGYQAHLRPPPMGGAPPSGTVQAHMGRPADTAAPGKK